MKTLYANLRKQATQALWRLTEPSIAPSDELHSDGYPSSRMQIYWPSAYQWSLARKWVGSLIGEFRQHLPVQFSDIPQPYRGIVLFQVAISGKLQTIAIDYSDASTIEIECLHKVSLYFKMQYARDGYEWNWIVPGGFVPADASLYRHLSYLRQLRDRQVFTHDVYGRFGRHLGTAIRTRAVEVLVQQQKFHYEGGLKKVRYQRSLQEVAQSKVCLDLPGNGSFCFRLVDYMAVGACIISYPHQTLLPSPLIDRQHIVYCQEDFSDLVELCAYYIENETAREQLCQQSRNYFDHYLDRSQLARYYLTTMQQYLI
jgi:hypothetical protein